MFRKSAYRRGYRCILLLVKDWTTINNVVLKWHDVMWYTTHYTFSEMVSLIIDCIQKQGKTCCEFFQCRLFLRYMQQNHLKILTRGKANMPWLLDLLKYIQRQNIQYISQNKMLLHFLWCCKIYYIISYLLKIFQCYMGPSCHFVTVGSWQ